MAKDICIDPQFIEKIKSLNLASMKTIDRIKVFDDILGEGMGRDINLLYEKSTLLKNKQLNKFIDDISGISAIKKAKIKERMAENLAEKQGKIKDEELFGIVKETLDRKYDLEIPDAEVEKMFNLRNEIDKLQLKAKGTPDGSEAKLALGEKIVELSDTIGELKNSTKGNIIQQIGKTLKESQSKIKSQKGVLGKGGQITKEVVENILGLPAKGIKAAWDASFIFRQGLKVLTADPKIWGNRTSGALKSWTKLLNKDAMESMVKAFKADIVTRDLYQDAIKSKLAIGVIEDFFPTNIAEKIPLIGNFFKASDDSFTMFSQGARMDLFEKYVKEYANATGSKPSKEIMDSMAGYVNALTGRGGLAKAEAASGWLNQLLFSARYQVANLKTFSDPLLAKQPEVRAIAAKNLAKHASIIFGTMTALSAITDVGFDPRETTFGKVRIPNSDKWVDITGGLAQYISTLVRMSPAVVGKVKYGGKDGFDIFTDFISGKLAPVPGAIRDYYSQRDYSGKKPTVGTTLNSLFMPITLDNIKDNYNNGEETTTQGLAALFDIIGAGVSQPKSKMEGSYGSPLDLISGK